MENTKIQWCDHTFNPWIGCTKVSPGCAHCYAETLMDTRYRRVKWGAGNPRSRTSASNWHQPIKWNREALGAIVRPRVFCASLADWLDDEVPIEWLAELLALIQATPNLDWLLLTKRPENWEEQLAQASEYLHPEGNIASCWLHGDAPENVWVGTTVENQEMADKRIPLLLEIPAETRFLSCEPLLEEIDIFAASFNPPEKGDDEIKFGVNHRGLRFGVDWVICGGESGPGARPMHPTWAMSVRDQCKDAGAPFYFKQWGEYVSTAAKEAVWKNGSTVPAECEPMAYRKVGKHAAGRLLDGVEYNEFPGALRHKGGVLLSRVR
jgi:protein gp37